MTPPRLDLKDQRFGRLTVISRATHACGQTAWLCRCDCGQEKIVLTSNLRGGNSTSCGCRTIENSIDAHITHGGSSSREYRVWHSIIARCHDSGSHAYHLYGARGIIVCDRWRHDFAAFLSDMGSRPSQKHSVDRRDNDGPYSPENCRWATWAEQCRNRRGNVRISFNGETKVLADWAKGANLDHTTLSRRLAKGIPLNVALLMPSQRRFQCGS